MSPRDEQEIRGELIKMRQKLADARLEAGRYRRRVAQLTDILESSDLPHNERPRLRRVV